MNHGRHYSKGQITGDDDELYQTILFIYHTPSDISDMTIVGDVGLLGAS